jgi:hypothetical protein
MMSDMEHRRAGWCIPGPLRPSRFVSLYRDHEVHNVEVNLAAIRQGV